MHGNNHHPSGSSWERYEQLSRLVELYELGGITHEQFERIKAEILAGETTPPRLRSNDAIELLVATYLDLDRLDASVNALRALVASSKTGPIDGAVIIRSSTGSVQVRSIAGLTRTSGEGDRSVIIALCGLLFPGEPVRIGTDSGALQDLLRYMERCGIADNDLCALGSGLPRGSHSIAVVYWPSRADDIADAFRGFEALTRKIQSDSVADAIIALIH